VYAETDLLVALAKPDDWLGEAAERALEEYEVETSLLAYVELLLVSDRYEFDRTRAVADLLDLVPLPDPADQQLVLRAATYQDEHGATTFDAFHAAIAESRDEAVLGSDGIYDDIGLERIALESLVEKDR
jgi:predicted nucleic acid-binding protein